MAGERRIGERRRETTVLPPQHRAPPLTPDREAHRPIPLASTRSRRIMLGVRSVSPAYVAGIGYSGLFRVIRCPQVSSVHRQTTHSRSGSRCALCYSPAAVATSQRSLQPRDEDDRIALSL